MTSPASRRRRVDHPHAIAFVPGKQPHEIGLADDQLRLQHAVGERADDSQASRRRAVRVEHEIVADAEVQDVHQRGLIRNRRNRAIVELAKQQAPRVGLLLGGRGHRCGKREARLFVEARLGRDDARVGRLVQREATGFVAGPQTEPRDARLAQHRIGALDAEAVAAFGGVGIEHQRRDRLGHQRIATRARVFSSERPVESLRNAPTLTSTKQANAISARLSTDRAGRAAVWRKPSLAIPVKPCCNALEAARAAEQHRAAHKPATSNAPPAPKKPAV